MNMPPHNTNISSASPPAASDIPISTLIALSASKSVPDPDIKSKLTQIIANFINYDEHSKEVPLLLQTVVDQISIILSSRLVELYLDNLRKATESVDDFMNLIEDGLIHFARSSSSTSSENIGQLQLYARRVALQIENLSFEAYTLFYEKYCEYFIQYDKINSDYQYRETSTNVEEDFHAHDNHNNDETMEQFLTKLLQTSKYQYSNKMREELHKYFDRNQSPQLRPYALTLLSAIHFNNKEHKLGADATLEAIRVAQLQQFHDSDAAISFALGWLYEHLSCSIENDDTYDMKLFDLLRQSSKAAYKQKLWKLASSTSLNISKFLITSTTRHQTRRNNLRDIWSMHRSCLAIHDRGLEEASKQSATHFPIQPGRNIANMNKYLPQEPIHDTLTSTAKADMVSSAIYECLNLTTMSSLEALACLETHQFLLTFEDKLYLLKKILYCFDHGVSNELFGKKIGTVYEKAIVMVKNYNITEETLVSIRLKLDFDWAIRRCDFEKAQVLLHSLESESLGYAQNQVHERILPILAKCHLLCRRNEWLEAREIIRNSSEICKTNGLYKQYVEFQLLLADTFLRSSNPAPVDALTRILECLGLLEKSELDSIKASIMFCIGKVNFALGDLEKAREILSGALPFIFQQGSIQYRGECLLTLAHINFEKAKSLDILTRRNFQMRLLKQALKQLSEAEKTFEGLEDLVFLKDVYCLMAKIYHELNMHNERNDSAEAFLFYCKKISSASACARC